MSEADLIYLLSLLLEKPSGSGLTLSQSSALEFRIIGSIASHYLSASCLGQKMMIWFGI